MKVSIAFTVTRMGLASEFINGPMVIIFTFLFMVGRQYSDLLRSGQFGGSYPGGSDVFRIAQNGQWTHTASCTMATGLFLRAKRSGRDVDLPPPLAPRLKKEYSYTFTLPLTPIR